MRIDRILLLLAIPAFTACGSPTASQDIVITASVSAPVVHPGQAISVTITIENHGTVVGGINGAQYCLPFSIRDPSGQDFTPDRGACALPIAFTQVAPGESQTMTYEWAGEVNERSEAGSPYLPSGTYFLRGVIGVEARGVVYSTPVEVTVVH